MQGFNKSFLDYGYTIFMNIVSFYKLKLDLQHVK